MASPNDENKRKREAKNDQLLNSFKQIALTSQVKQAIDHYRSLPRIPKFPWSECYQPASALVNFKDEQALLIIFTRYLTLKEALRLGQTCRRMYHLYKRSCTEERQSLTLVVDRSSAARAPNQPLVSYSFLFESVFTTSTADTVSGHDSAITAIKPLPCSRLDHQTPSGDLPLYSLHQLLTVIVPSLTYLEISASMGLFNLPALCQTLQRGCFTYLETLKLYLNCAEVDGDDDADEQCRSVLSRNGGFCQLNLPRLKHLTLVLLHGQLIAHDEGENRSKTKTYSPLTIRSPRLRSLHLATADALPRLCSLVHQYVLLSREQHGMGEGSSSSGSTVGGNDIQIAYHLRSDHAAELREMLRDASTGCRIHAYSPALGFITQVQVQPRYIPPLDFCCFLPLMTRLRAINFWAGSTVQEAYTYYPTLLFALTTLQALTKVTVDFTGFGNGARCIGWPALPVLSSVRDLELHYPIKPVEHAPLQQVNIVEQLQLVRCFPRLTSLKVHFEQLSSVSRLLFGQIGGAGKGDNELMAAQALVRGLSRLRLQPEKKEVIFTFKDRRFTILYVAADNSVVRVHSKK
ncbi:hypothetical protein TYRP_017112 [Tyrophagus putrescentiae]|nr:hypothetical protein TYRP_017112 [Tyrophagus putrescentiae]